MALAKQTPHTPSEDPETRRLAREREEAIKLYECELAANRAEAAAQAFSMGFSIGFSQGLSQGLSQALLEQLGLRFGPLPAATQAHVAAATREQLDAWAERLLTAPSLDEVLAP